MKIRDLIFPASIIVLFSILLTSGFHYSRIQEDDGVRINLAGRQRMLSQKITKEILLYNNGEIPSDIIKQSMKIFFETQQALINGGDAPVDLGSERYRFIPGTKDKTSMNELIEVARELEPVNVRINEFLVSKDKGALKFILAHNDSLLLKIDSAVFELQLNSEKNNRITRIIIICSFLLISILVSVNFYSRIKELRLASARIKELETILPICSNCKKIRIDNDHPIEPESWTTIEKYLHDNKDMLFSHSICPDCIKKLYPGMLEKMKK